MPLRGWLCGGSDAAAGAHSDAAAGPTLTRRPRLALLPSPCRPFWSIPEVGRSVCPSVCCLAEPSEGQGGGRGRCHGGGETYLGEKGGRMKGGAEFHVVMTRCAVSSPALPMSWPLPVVRRHLSGRLAPAGPEGAIWAGKHEPGRRAGAGPTGAIWAGTAGTGRSDRHEPGRQERYGPAGTAGTNQADRSEPVGTSRVGRRDLGRPGASLAERRHARQARAGPAGTSRVPYHRYCCAKQEPRDVEPRNVGRAA